MSKWFDVLARFCAGSCGKFLAFLSIFSILKTLGLCTRTACRDYSEKCREMKNLCLDESHIDFMRANCSRTCGFCVVGPGGASESEFFCSFGQFFLKNLQVLTFFRSTKAFTSTSMCRPRVELHRKRTPLFKPNARRIHDQILRKDLFQVHRRCDLVSGKEFF